MARGYVLPSSYLKRSNVAFFGAISAHMNKEAVGKLNLKERLDFFRTIFYNKGSDKMHIYNYMKGALTKMVKALIPRQSTAKSTLVKQKYNSSLTKVRKRKLLQGKSVLCTVKYFQSDGVDVDENEEKCEEETE